MGMSTSVFERFVSAPPAEAYVPGAERFGLDVSKMHQNKNLPMQKCTTCHSSFQTLIDRAAPGGGCPARLVIDFSKFPRQSATNAPAPSARIY